MRTHGIENTSRGLVYVATAGEGSVRYGTLIRLHVEALGVMLDGYNVTPSPTLLEEIEGTVDRMNELETEAAL